MADVWIKFCGCESFDDVELAARSGADAFGMIFAPSPRRIAPQAAAAIARRLPVDIAPVAVFVNPRLDDVEKTREVFPRAFLQFSGDESPDLVARYGDRAIKAIHVESADRTLEERCARFPDAMLLFDTRRGAQYGGTGRRFDWQLVSALAASRRVVVAGGLDDTNVAECVRSLHPFGVDVRSGIETGDRKDPQKMDAFVRAVRAER